MTTSLTRDLPGEVLRPGDGGYDSARAVFNRMIDRRPLAVVRCHEPADVARGIVTQGMRLSPAEPTFLDERDAILAADRQLFPDADHSGQIWQVFAARGMG